MSEVMSGLSDIIGKKFGDKVSSKLAFGELIIGYIYAWKKGALDWE